MNRLQLYISKSTRECVTLVEINGSSEGRCGLADLRPIVSAVDYRASSKTLFYAIVNIKGGYMIHVLRTIPPTRPWHLDATIFVPAELDIMSEDLTEVIETVSEKVLAPSVTESDMAQLRELFEREYDTRDRKLRVKTSSGSETAMLMYDDDASGRSLSDIIDNGLYRPEWSAYKAVLLLGDGLSAMPGAVIDLDADEDGDDSDHDTDDYPDNKQSSSSRKNVAHNYIFSLPLHTPDGRSSLEFEVQSSKTISRSPIPGYELKGKASEDPDTVNRLRRKTAASAVPWKGKLIWLLAGLLAGFALARFTGCHSEAENPAEVPATTAVAEIRQSSQKPKSATKKQSGGTEVKTEHSEASYYLDSHRVWRREDMEKIDGLKGLFDDLDNYRFDRLTDEWASKLSASKNFSKIVKAANKATAKKVDPRRDNEHNPRYNREGDSSISWLGYAYWIDP